MTKDKQSASERPHHAFSPSSLQPREACPYYDPRQGDNEASLAGTKQHDAVDAGIDNPELSDSQAAAVAECISFFDDLTRKYPGGTVIKEQYLPIDDFILRYKNWDRTKATAKGTTAGYVDGAVISKDGKMAEIADWKFGAWAVEDASNNLQGIGYLLGLFARFPKIETVTVHFLLPHRDEHNHHTFHRNDFDKLYRRVRTVVERAINAREENDFNKATPNLGSCIFCGNAGRCDALARVALVIGHKYAPLKIPATITPSLLKDPKETGEGMRIASVVESWAKAYRTQASARAVEEEGFIPEGYILISSEAREIKDKKKLRAILKDFGLSEEEIDSTSKFFITPIEALIKSKALRGEKESTAKEFTEKAIEAGAIELGSPKAFLQMDRKKTEKSQVQ